jgi:hypothetical protein
VAQETILEHFLQDGQRASREEGIVSMIGDIVLQDDANGTQTSTFTRVERTVELQQKVASPCLVHPIPNRGSDTWSGHIDYGRRLGSAGRLSRRHRCFYAVASHH